MARTVEQDELKDPGAKTKKDIAFAVTCKDAKACRAIAEALASEPEATLSFKLERQYALKRGWDLLRMPKSNPVLQDDITASLPGCFVCAVLVLASSKHDERKHHSIDLGMQRLHPHVEHTSGESRANVWKIDHVDLKFSQEHLTEAEKVSIA